MFVKYSQGRQWQVSSSILMKVCVLFARNRITFISVGKSEMRECMNTEVSYGESDERHKLRNLED